MATFSYMRVKWKHGFPDEPVLLYSELDEERWEVRKVDVFADGTCGFADQDEEVGGTGLGELPVPPLNEIAQDPEFEPADISGEEFESIWSKRRERPRVP
jgi:hypothetical protein